MIYNLKTLILIQILFCLVSFTKAQTTNDYYATLNNSDKQSVENIRLPKNSVQFIFGKANLNSQYTNPGVAVLNMKNGYNNTKYNVTETNENLFRHKINTITQENICMFSNRTDDELWVQLQNITLQENKLNLEIYNSSGERVYHAFIESELHKINVCDFTKGVFLVKLEDNVQKMVIE